MIDDASLVIGRFIVWWAITIAAVVGVAAIAGIFRDLMLKLKRR